MSIKNKVAVIGSGPAGFTAAIYLSRASLDVTVYTGMQIGGQPSTTSEVENYPGFPEGVMGPDLVEKMQKQAENFGAKVVMGTVASVKKVDDKFALNVNAEDVLYDAVIVASGASPRFLGLLDEEKWVGKGYHFCATCDGFFYRNKTIAVIGGGDSAMEEANFLTKFADKVYLIHRRNEFRASKIMIERVKTNPKIEILYNKQISKIKGQERVDELELTDTETDEKSNLKIDGVFAAIGHKPNTEFLEGFLPIGKGGYLETAGDKQKTTMTLVPGVFVAGDVADPIYRQSIVAAGEGAKAAMDCERWLESVE